MPDDSVGLVNRAIELAPAQLLTVGEFTYIDKSGKTELFTPPAAPTVEVTTLSSLVALLAAGVDGVDLSGIIVHVASYATVSVRSILSDKYGRRHEFIRASLIKQDPAFAFNIFVPQETFNIQLSALFVLDTNSADLLTISGNLTKQAEVRQQDDGITQTVTAKSGVSGHLVAERTVKPRVTLQPYRTFREAQQPDSDFIFRVKSDERQGNMCALFEADGGYWKIRAMQNVALWLSNALAGAVTTEKAIPVLY